MPPKFDRDRAFASMLTQVLHCACTTGLTRAHPFRTVRLSTRSMPPICGALRHLPHSNFMAVFRTPPAVACVCTLLLVLPRSFPQSSDAASLTPVFPGAETLSYSIEWRLIYAGDARITIIPDTTQTSRWETKVHLESGGLVSRLYKIDDSYRVQMQDQFCATNSVFDATEGKRHHETLVTFDGKARKASYLERDLLKNTVIHRAETEIPPCVSDFLGALYKLRTLHLTPGQNTTVPMSDGKKSVAARVEAQEREQVQTKAGTFPAIRYEAFVFNGVLFKKNARLQIWLSDDERKMPVQFRARMPFPIGSITFQLDKVDRS